MKIRCYFNNWFAKLISVYAITLYPFIFFSVSKEDAIKFHIVNHEYVHILQVRKLGWLKFYWTYLIQYFKSRLSGKSANTSYHSVSYEIEAYAKENSQELPQGFI